MSETITAPLSPKTQEAVILTTANVTALIDALTSISSVDGKFIESNGGSYEALGRCVCLAFDTLKACGIDPDWWREEQS